MLSIQFRRFISASFNKMTAKTIILAKNFEGFPQEDNFKVVEEELPPLSDGQFLVQAKYLAVDPYMRLFSNESHVGRPLMGEQVAEVIESKNPNFKVGEYVLGEWGWRSRTIASATPGSFYGYVPRPLTDHENLPPSIALGITGMPGNTAYFGFLKVCKPESGNTVVVSAASGAVGSHVGQLAKIKGCRVVGITGSDEKGKRLVTELGFDKYVNYKSPDFVAKLAEATPDRVDYYFDNVGGEVSSAVLNRLAKFARVAICGAVSTYNSDGSPQKASEVQTPVKINCAKMEGFHVTRWKNEWEEGTKQNLQWVREGRLNPVETVTEGFDKMPAAFMGMLRGANFGKALVKV